MTEILRPMVPGIYGPVPLIHEKEVYRWTAGAISFFIPIVSAIAPLYDIFGFQTLVFIALAGLGFLRAARAGSIQVPIYFRMAAVMSCLLLFGVTHTMVQSYGLDKSLRVCLWWLVVPFGVFLLVKRQADLSALLVGLMLGTFVALCVLVCIVGPPWQVLSEVQQFYRLSVGSQDPISFSRFLGEGALLLAGCTILTRKTLVRNAAWLGIVCLLFYMILSGSKGPLIALVPAGLLLFSKRLRGVFAGIVVITGVVLVAMMVMRNVLPAGFIEYRFGVLDTESAGSVTSRLQLIFVALSHFESSTISGMVFGAGTGNYPHLIGLDGRMYPHNIFVEVLYENGLIGFFVLGAVCLIAVWTPFKERLRSTRGAMCRSDKELTIVLSMYVFFIVNSMFTGDLGSNFNCGVWGGILLAAVHCRRRVRHARDEQGVSV